MSSKLVYTIVDDKIQIKGPKEHHGALTVISSVAKHTDGSNWIWELKNSPENKRKLDLIIKKYQRYSDEDTSEDEFEDDKKSRTSEPTPKTVANPSRPQPSLSSLPSYPRPSTQPLRPTPTQPLRQPLRQPTQSYSRPHTQYRSPTENSRPHTQYRSPTENSRTIPTSSRTQQSLRSPTSSYSSQSYSRTINPSSRTQQSLRSPTQPYSSQSYSRTINPSSRTQQSLRSPTQSYSSPSYSRTIPTSSRSPTTYPNNERFSARREPALSNVYNSDRRLPPSNLRYPSNNPSTNGYNSSHSSPIRGGSRNYTHFANKQPIPQRTAPYSNYNKYDNTSSSSSDDDDDDMQFSSPRRQVIPRR
jgi:hypothetical protein